jgi:hypothetical protein
LAILPLLALGGCAERDNPFDPANRQSVGPTPVVVPEPRPTTTALVVDPDSACRGCPFYGNIDAALANSHAGDTVWIQGGRTYEVDLMNLSKGGTFARPFLFRSFGGEARFVPSRKGIQNLLRISQPYVVIRGLAFVGADGDGVIVNNVVGPVTIDSSRIDSCGESGMGAALRAGNGVRLRLHHLRLTHNATTPALTLEAGATVEDSLAVVETPRP